jgi:hypothetical protein
MALLTLSNLLPDVLGRIEEANPPTFWSLTGEVYPAMVDGIFEASLITGVVQLVSVQVTLTAGTTWFSLQASGGGSYASPTVPVGIVAPLRMKAPYGIRKSSLKSLDDMFPAWQSQPPGTQIISWFPLGVSGFGIYPQLVAEANVVMDFLVCPISTPRPYSGSEQIPLQQEYSDLLSKYAAAYLRCKEGGAESDEAATVFEAYLSEVKALSIFQNRLDSLNFSAAYGGRSQVNPKTIE